MAKHKAISKARRIRLEKMHGCKCINCNSSDEIEWHHVVPLEIGGNDVDENIVPLCYSCHKAVTNHQLVLITSGRSHKKGGRKRTIPENYKAILHDYLYCRITKTECNKRLGLSHKNKSWTYDSPWFKEYLDELGIKKYRNNIEVIAKKGVLMEGSIVGYIERFDGSLERIKYIHSDTNDEIIEKVFVENMKPYMKIVTEMRNETINMNVIAGTV